MWVLGDTPNLKHPPKTSMHFSFSQCMAAGCSGLLQDTQQSCFVLRVIKEEGLEEEAVHIGLGTLGFCRNGVVSGGMTRVGPQPPSSLQTRSL